MLIDNVGLHRIFGLPVRERDWEAMFEGRILGDTFSRKRAENGLSVACSLLEEGRREEEWEMVMTHGQLLDAIRNRNLSDQEEGRNALSVLKAFHDRCSGLWGLRRRNRVTVMPRYKEVFDTCADRAAVCLEDGRTGVVDDNGKPKIIIDRCRRLRFLKGELLAVTGNDGTDAYIDLKTDRTYREKPVVCSYGSGNC